MLLLAGSSDTSVAAMTALTHFTFKEPRGNGSTAKEIRFTLGDSSESITVAAVSKLEYLDAVLREAMQIHAPPLTRNPVPVDRPGVHVCGIPITQGTRVDISQKTAYRLPRNFVRKVFFQSYGLQILKVGLLWTKKLFSNLSWLGSVNILENPML